ncbi:NACHT, LRR and PYD domains-containing protein 12 [Podochytrium sp. JEL0797]|nr:NACHT, LRR and PYD domains-containing protein 12 [Podochytrium sp. JEL0797]
MSAKKGKAKENDEEVAALRAAALKKIKVDYPLHCKRYITEPIQLVTKRIDKAITALEDLDKSVITSYPLTPNEIYALSATFEGYAPLTALYFWTSPIDSRGLDGIAKFSIRHPNITTLHLIDCKITPAMTPHLAHLLKDSKTLTTLVLDHNGLGSLGAVNVFMGIRANPSSTVLPPPPTPVPKGGTAPPPPPCSIKNLSMRYCDIGSKAAEAIAGTIATNIGLIELDLSGNAIGDDGLFTLSKSFSTNTTLKTLRLQANNIQNREMGYNGGYQPPLTMQQASAVVPTSPQSNLPLQNTSINALCEILSNACSGLALLDLSGNHIGVPGGEAILEMLKTRKPLAAAKQCEATQVEVSERMGDELFSSICDMNDVMADIFAKNNKAAKGGKKGGKKGKK